MVPQARMAVRFGTLRICVLRTSHLERTVPAYCTSVQFLKHTVPTYCTCTITKKAYHTSVLYLLGKNEAYRTVAYLRTGTVLPSFLLTTRNFNCF